MALSARDGLESSDHHCQPRDSVDILLESWREQRPELDFSGLSVIARLARVRSHIDADLEAVYAAYGLTAANFAVLVTLTRIGGDAGVSQRRLMDELGLTSGTISVRVDRLVDEGLVTRRPDPESRRNTLIALTERGRDVFERVVPVHLATERRLLTSLAPDEEELLAAVLRKLLVEFEGSLPSPQAPLRLGLVLAPAHEAMALRASVGLPPMPALLVRRLDDTAPAAAAGVAAGDLLMRAGGRDLRSVGALYAAIDDAAGAGQLHISLLRGTEPHDVTVRLDGAAPIDGRLATPAGRSARGEHLV